ncbi:MAG TPA: response regulator [Candidatus Dormibacteraeota bacterium]|jgi:DNA-binding NtrC family response regulator|nr:response regulator [Candidatus Dormibacteraeota bacterium]
MEGYRTITRRALVLSSNAANSRVIEEATRAWMFETIDCSSLEQVKGFLAEKDVAVIFCDERFEDGTYSDLLSVVQRSYSSAVVVMISAVDQDSVFREAVASGALGVVASPCSIQDVQWMVIRATERRTSGSKSMQSSRSTAAGGVNGLSQRK